MQRSGKSSRSAPEFLDVAEQDRVIEELQREGEQQQQLFRSLCAALFAICALLMAFCLTNFLFYPFSLVHETRFQDEFPESFFVIFYLFSTGVCLCSATICWVSLLDL